MNLSATMSLKSEKFEGPLASARRGLGNLVGIIGSLASPLAALGVSFAAFRSAEGIVEGFKGVFDAGRELKAQSAIYGQSIRDLVVLRKAFKDADIGAEALPGTLALLQNALGGVNEEGQPTKKIFDQLGLSIDALKGQSAIEQIKQIGAAIRGLGDQESKVAAARAIFGRGGVGTLALLNDPKLLDSAASQMASQAEAYSRNAETFTRVSHEIEAVGNKVRGIFVGAAAYAAPVIEPILEKIRSIDTVGIAQRLGQNLTQAVQLLQAAYHLGELSDLVGLSIKVGIEDAVPVIQDKLTKALTGPLQDFAKGLKNAWDQAFSRKSSDPNDILGSEYKKQTQRDLDTATAEYEKSDDEAAKNHYHDPVQVAQTNALLGRVKELQARLDGMTRDEAPKQEVESRNGVVMPVSSDKAALDALIANLKQAIPKPQEITPIEAPKGTNTFFDARADDDKTGHNKSYDGDRLAKIGLFVGGSGGVIADYARRTADNTDKINEGIKALLQKAVPINNPEASFAAFA